MHKQLTITLLAVCATLLAVNIVVSLRSPLPAAFSQATGAEGGGFILATGQSQGGSDQILWVYEVGTRKLAAYAVKTRGIEYKGVRQITWDLVPQELVPKGSMSVESVKKALEK